jgi:hypothetical protein
MPTPRDAAPDDAQTLLQLTEDALARTTKLLQRAAGQLRLVRPETPHLVALRNELQVLMASVHLLDQAVVRERARANCVAPLLKVAG